MQITHRYTQAVLFEHDVPDNSMRLTVEAAVKAGANLRGADLGSANLYGADLGSANLYGADLGSANLGSANLYGASLRGADLGGANLVCADLGSANLYGANLYGANLRGADLGDANLWRADLRGAKGIISGGTPDGWTCYGWLREGVLSIRVGCREKRFDEAVEYWSGTENRREVLIACHYVASVAVVRGWRTA